MKEGKEEKRGEEYLMGNFVKKRGQTSFPRSGFLERCVQHTAQPSSHNQKPMPFLLLVVIVSGREKKQTKKQLSAT